jgi:predicted nuclease with TOPRIM domain
MKRLVVRHYNPVRLALVLAGLALMAVAVGWGLLEYARARSGFDFDALREEAQLLSDTNEELHRTIGSLREQQAVLERSQQIEREAYKQLEGTVTGLQEEISELKSELAFYRSIVAPSESAGGLRVQTFEVGGNGLDRGYRYKLVLTQVAKNDTVVRGRAEVAIEGSKEGRMTVLNLAQLDPSKGDFEFKFKYFQNFEGDFQLPAGFSPQRVIVKVSPRDTRSQPVEKLFNWPT